MSPQTSTPESSAPRTAPQAPDGQARATAAQHSGRVRHALDILGKRRRFLVDTRTQLRAGVLSTLVAGLLLTLLNFSLHSARIAGTEAVLAESPELRLVLESQNRTEFALVFAASVVFLAGVFVVTILETHKTAGAALNVTRHLELVRDGIYTKRLRLRQGDNLGDVETAFNEMCQALEQQSTIRAAELERLAGTAEALAGPDEALALAVELRSHAGTRPHA